MLKNILKYFFLLFLALVLAFGLYNYKKNLPLEYLVQKYSYADSEFIKVDGLDVHYRKSGNGPVFLLIHGFGANLRNWESWHELLKDRFTIVSLDLPGYGLTGPRQDKDHSNRSQVKFLEHFVEAIKIDSFYLAGNSMGGGICWNYSLEYPERVRKMILVNSAGYPSDARDEESVLGFKILRMPVINRLATRITPRFVLKKSIRAIYADPSKSSEEEVDVFMDLIRREGNREVLVERMTSSWEDNSSNIKNISVPTLVMWGDKDQVIDVKFADKFHADIPHSELLIYENVGHVPMMEVPIRSARDAANFINKKSDNQPIK